MTKKDCVYIYIDEKGIKIVNKHEDVIIRTLLDNSELLPGYIVRADKIYKAYEKTVPQLTTENISLDDPHFWDGTEAK